MYIISLPAIFSNMPPDRAQSGPHKRAPQVICAQIEKLCLEYSSPDICDVDLQNHV